MSPRGCDVAAGPLPDALHAQVEYEVDVAYSQGYADGRQAFAAELLPAVRWMLAGLGWLGGEDDAFLLTRLLAADFDDLMERHLRAVDRQQRRQRWDQANRPAA